MSSTYIINRTTMAKAQFIATVRRNRGKGKVVVTKTGSTVFVRFVPNAGATISIAPVPSALSSAKLKTKLLHLHRT